MIINGANFNMNISAGAGLAGNKAENKSIARNLGIKRNDKLDLSELFKKYTAADSSQKTEIKKMILEISEKDGLSDVEMAKKCYSKMKKTLRSEIRHAEHEIEWYNKLSEEKQYYQDLIRSTSGDSVRITGGKYLLEDLDDGTVVSKDKLYEAIDYVNKKIENDLISKKGYVYDTDWEAPDIEEILEELKRRHTEVIIPDTFDREIDENKTEIMNRMDDWSRRAYNYYAGTFGKIIGYGSELCVDENDPLFSKEGYTVENFIEKTEERIKLLNGRLDSIKDAMESYLEKEKALEAYLPNKDITAKLTMFFRQQESESELLDEFADSISSAENT